jgi:hypothetical protein
LLLKYKKLLKIIIYYILMNSICSFSKLKNFNILLVDNINTISAISGTYTLNQSDYAIGGENVYFISNSTTPSSTGDASTNQSGTFTINVASATKIIYYMIFAGGGGGGCGSETGAGGASGDILISSVTLSQGTYNCSYQIGGGGGGASFTSSSSNIPLDQADMVNQVEIQH